MCDSLGNDDKKQVRKNDNKRKMGKRLIEEDFKGAIQEGPTYICDICWKFEFQRNVINLRELKYQTDIYNKYIMVNQLAYVKAVTIL